MHFWYGDWAKTKIESIFSSFFSAYRLFVLCSHCNSFAYTHACITMQIIHSFIHDHSHTKSKSHKLSAGI